MEQQSIGVTANIIIRNKDIVGLAWGLEFRCSGNLLPLYALNLNPKALD